MVFLSSKRLERGWKVLVWEKVKTLCNKRLPNGKKSDKEIYQNAKICYKRGKHGRRLREKTSEKSSMKSEKTYQNAQICYETWDMREDSVRKLPGSLPWS